MINAEKREVNRYVPDKGLTWQKRVPLFDSSSCATCGTTNEARTRDKGQKPCRDSEDMLIKAWRKPLTQTDLYKDLGLSGYRGNKCKLELVRLGLAYEVKLPTNRRGRQKVLLQVTPKGLAYLEKLGVAAGSKSRGRGGVKHLYYQNRVKQWYEEHGYVAEIEARVGDTSLDVLVVCSEGSRLGVEIALSEQYEETNAVKAVGTGIERVLFLVESEMMMERLRRRVESEIRGVDRVKVGYKLVDDYLGK